MTILFGVKYFGKDTSVVPSKFLVFIIEEYEQADWSLIQACKQELSARLKLDWEPPKPEVVELRRALTKAETEIEHLRLTLIMSTICKGNQIIVQQYLNSPEYLKEHLKIIKEQ